MGTEETTSCYPHHTLNKLKIMSPVTIPLVERFRFRIFSDVVYRVLDVLRHVFKASRIQGPLMIPRQKQTAWSHIATSCVQRRRWANALLAGFY